MSKKNSYWSQRAIEQERLKDEIARDYIERTEKQLREYERQLKREIEAFYARYGIEHKMTQKEAMKYLRDDERKEFQEATLEKFREMALDPNADQALLDALSYRHRISRKEALLAEIQSKTAQLYAKPGGLKDTAEQALSDVYVRGKVETAKMFAKAGIIHEPKLDKHMIKERMNFKWTDKHFSERIWGQNRRTYEAIATVLNNGFTGGWSLDRIKKELSAKIKGVPLHRMDTLIKTEATAFNTLAMKDMLLELDTKKYSIVAVIDSRTSEICNHQNEKVYDMDRLEIGVTAPPFHPRCRSTIAPVEDEDDFDYFQEPEDRKANGKRTLDEILADWESKAEEILKQSEIRNKKYTHTTSPVSKLGNTDVSDSTGVDSLAKHTRDGQLTPEREKLHQEIVKDFFKDAERPKGQPIFTVMGGGPASGKSTMIEKGAAKLPPKTLIVDSDAIKSKLPEYQDMLKGAVKGAAEYVHEESSALAKRIMAVGFDEGFNMTLDGTGDGSIKSLTKKLDSARRAGMRVEGIYATVPTEEALRRSAERGKQTGRHVPEWIIAETHKKVSNILEQTAHLFDSVSVYDTSNEVTLIATGGSGKDLTPTEGNEELFNAFIDKGKN